MIGAVDGPKSTMAPISNDRRPVGEGRGWSKHERSAFTGTPQPV